MTKKRSMIIPYTTTGFFALDFDLGAAFDLVATAFATAAFAAGFLVLALTLLVFLVGAVLAFAVFFAGVVVVFDVFFAGAAAFVVFLTVAVFTGFFTGAAAVFVGAFFTAIGCTFSLTGVGLDLEASLTLPDGPFGSTNAPVWAPCAIARLS